MIEHFFNLHASNYQVDSRIIKKNDVFFALKGERVDGHDFLRDIELKGAKACIIEKDFNGYVPNIQVFRVDGVLKFLQDIAREALKKSKAFRIGITGSFGKTTTKEFLVTILKEKYSVSSTYKNYNSQIGLPLSILNMDRNVDFLVFEMGMDKKHEIENLVSFCQIDLALITKVDLIQEGFKNVEDVAQAKKEIFLSKNIKNKILNFDLLKLKTFHNEKFITFSIKNKNADFYLKNSFFYEKNLKIKLFFPFSEKHFLENALAAISIARILNIDFETIQKGINNLKTVNMRYEKVFIKDALFIKDFYNSNFTTMKESILSLKNYKNRKIFVLGGMPHMVNINKNCHRKILNLAKKYSDNIFLYGKQWENLNHFVYKDLKDIALKLNEILKKDDIVLLKSARFYKLENIFDFIN